MKKYLFTLLLVFSGIIYAQDTMEFTDLYGDYLGQIPPGDTPVVFAPGIVSTIYMEHSTLAISPDGTQLFFTSLMPYIKSDGPYFAEKEGDTWSESKNIGLVGGG